MADRDAYYQACLDRGVPESTAAQIADGLMRAHERARADLPGWEHLMHQTPDAVRARARLLFHMAAVSLPSDSTEAQTASGVQATFAYGVLVGMLMADRGHLPSQVEREAAAQNLPEITAWISSLSKGRQ